MEASSVAALDYAGRVKGLGAMIGNTPLLAVNLTYRGRRRVIYAKAEQMNMTGSIKDRMAYHILTDAYRQGKLRPGDTIVEATSGNTGISFAAAREAQLDRLADMLEAHLDLAAVETLLKEAL